MCNRKLCLPLSSSIRLCIMLESANILAQASSLHTVPTRIITCNTQSSSAAPSTEMGKVIRNITRKFTGTVLVKIYSQVTFLKPTLSDLSGRNVISSSHLVMTYAVLLCLVTNNLGRKDQQDKQAFDIHPAQQTCLIKPSDHILSK